MTGGVEALSLEAESGADSDVRATVGRVTEGNEKPPKVLDADAKNVETFGVSTLRVSGLPSPVAFSLTGLSLFVAASFGVVAPFAVSSTVSSEALPLPLTSEVVVVVGEVAEMEGLTRPNKELKADLTGDGSGASEVVGEALSPLEATDERRSVSVPEVAAA